MDIKQRRIDIIRNHISIPFSNEDVVNLIKKQGVKGATKTKWELQLELLRRSLPNMVEYMMENPASLCPYCYQYKSCDVCPVQEKTGKAYCGNTGYTEFLFSLRQYRKNPTYLKQQAMIRQCKNVLKFVETLD